MPPLKIIKLSIFIFATVITAGCSNGKIAPENTLAALHLKKSEGYKNRPGWAALVALSNDDCQASKSHGTSLIDWGDSACTPSKLIETVNAKPELIPVFYAAYHEYGEGKNGVVKGLARDGYGLSETSTQSLLFMSNLAVRVSDKKTVEAVYSDFKGDRWSMGLADVSESDFKLSLSKFADKAPEIKNKYDQAERERIDKVVRENERISAEQDKRRAEIEASLTSMRFYPDFGSTPSASEKLIKQQLDQLKFTRKQSVDGSGRLTAGMGYYLEGRKIYPTGYFDVDDFIRSIRISIRGCYEVGAYTESKAVNNACVEGIAQGIKEWGAAARDKSISDRAWFYGASEGTLRHSALVEEILFSHWAGMARVYSSRGM
ncbi:hypothetical protein [Serratia sp. JSRIV004]|uniref:hypothetical protein n=1 Tax=Serratia sp. JSRIV004 TaxID=2831895 RepID=UPI001CBF4941|nr:hypothetical protein [Serratia sp. JSRIV004]UAN57412.1 hypothetical protein KGP21_28135 [Serratia sp. JSRIV004]